MPRAKPFSRLEAERRSRKTLVDPALIEKLVEIAGAASKDTKETLRRKLNHVVAAYFARRVGDSQESPARIAAALKPLIKSAEDLLAGLGVLPIGMLIELRAGGIIKHLHGLKEHLPRIPRQAEYWRRHVKAHRPVGEAVAGEDLRRALREIYNDHCLSLRNKHPKAKKRYLDDLVAQACTEIGAKFPDRQKHQGRFAGRRKRLGRRGPKLHLQPLRKSAAQRKMEGVLKDLRI